MQGINLGLNARRPPTVALLEKMPGPSVADNTSYDIILYLAKGRVALEASHIRGEDCVRCKNKLGKNRIMAYTDELK